MRSLVLARDGRRDLPRLAAFGMLWGRAAGYGGMGSKGGRRRKGGLPMQRVRRAAGTVMIAVCAAGAPLTFGGCGGQRAVGPGGTARTVEPATPEQQAALIDRVKALSGEWEMIGGTPMEGQVTNVFAVSSNGSVVREIMFPGGSHEMTNVYHMDGPDLVVTHYCAAGNQPRMRARTGGAGQIRFEPDGVTNLYSASEKYMAQLTLVFTGSDRLRQEWRSMENGVLMAEPTVFELKRKK